MINKYEIDIPVALIFFNRDDVLRAVFERIKIARPSKLFLIQDGARKDNLSDVKKILECRKIVEDIDWDCEVYKNYSEHNMGCGKRVSSGISWVFEHVDNVVIVEDDCVIEPTFLNFCKEMLEKYKNDSRVSMISALNHFEEWDCGDCDYFFAKAGAIAAWATWKRVWDEFDFRIDGYQDKYLQKVLKQSLHHDRLAKANLKTWKRVYELGQQDDKKIKFWGPQFAFLKYKSGALSVVPKRTMSCNIGVGKGATFSGANLKMMNKKERRWFFQKTYPMELPIKHPNAILPDEEYDKKYYDITCPNKLKAFFQKLCYFIKKNIYKNQ